MARDFSKNTTNYMTLGGNAIGPLLHGAARISVHVRVRYDTLSATSDGDDLFNVPITDSFSGIALRGRALSLARFRLQARVQSSENAFVADGTTNIVVGAEYFVGGVVDIAGDRIRLYQNGAQQVSSVATFGAAVYTNATHSTYHDTVGSTAAAGAGTPLSVDRQTDGQIGELAFWADDIDDAGFVALADGAAATLIRPDALLFYMPLLGEYSPEIDVRSGKRGTISGSVPAVPHFRVYRSAGSLMGAVPGADIGSRVLIYAGDDAPASGYWEA